MMIFNGFKNIYWAILGLFIFTHKDHKLQVSNVCACGQLTREL